MSVVYSPDGNLIATGSMDDTVRLWNVGTMACTNTLIGHSEWINGVVFSSGGDQLASAGRDSTVRLWNVATGECCLTLTGHDDAVRRVTYSPKGDLLASGSDDETVRLWDVASGQCRTVVQNFQGNVLGVAWVPSADSNFLITGCQDGSVLKWQVIGEEERCHVELCWAAPNGSLTVTGASIQDVRGLTSLNKQLLKQRGAKDEPENLLREASKKLITMASVVSQMRQPSGGMVPDSSSPITNISDEQPQQQAEQQVEIAGGSAE
jgi:WD40 repeat protein